MPDRNDWNRQTVEAFRATHGIPRAYADVEPMLAAEQPDLVHIATPPPTPGFTAARRLVGRMWRIGRRAAVNPAQGWSWPAST
jgi:hypothetical protein